ncbi:MAG TPA: efflux RND transporter periplasmic adaptor subunit [Burkholderiales bacterium]|nr:efflux RND transporter periplasmic adaptor subunit [Burkholderiales bacterium]
MKSDSPSADRPRRIPHRWIAVGVIALVFLAALVWGILPRLEATAALKKETQALNIPTVSVIRPKTGDASQELVLPGNMQPFVDTPIYARTNGYLKRWTADIGAHVKTGQLLAEIDTPEVDDQLHQARADLATAEANYKLAEKTAARWQALLKTESVSQQEADQTQGDMEAKKAALESARFNVSRLEKMQAFKRIYAPFDGVITARNTDVGALIDAGSGGGPGKELFHLASTQKLRVYINVPQFYSRDAAPGVEAGLTLTEFPGRVFKGTLVRTTQAIDAASRTMLAEVAVDNPTGELLPGSYAQVHLKLHSSNTAFIVPVNTLIFRSDGIQVAVVQPDQRVALKKILVGRDFGTEVEVMSGIEKEDAVVLNPADSLASGAQVRVVKQVGDKAGDKKP